VTTLRMPSITLTRSVTVMTTFRETRFFPSLALPWKTHWVPGSSGNQRLSTAVEALKAR
jgi:hypothetical protein